MDFQVNDGVKKERLYKIQELLGSQQLEFNSKFLNQNILVLIEKTKTKFGQVMGRSPWMQSVYMDKKEGKIGEIKTVKVTLAGKNSLTAKKTEKIRRFI